VPTRHKEHASVVVSEIVLLGSFVVMGIVVLSSISPLGQEGQYMQIDSKHPVAIQTALQEPQAPMWLVPLLLVLLQGIQQRARSEDSCLSR